MALYNSSYLKQLSANKSYTVRERVLNESKKLHTGFDIFLSHSFLDKDEVEGIYIELTSLGFTVYVDWIVDPKLDRNNVTKESAEHIRNRMKISRSLLLAISANAAMSKWIPWELGFIDGLTNLCAIFPVSKDPSPPATFKRSEYLLLYPYIKRAIVNYTSEIFITESSNYYTLFENWIKRNAKPSYNLKNIDLL